MQQPQTFSLRYRCCRVGDVHKTSNDRPIPLLDLPTRRARGQQVRKHCPRSAHAAFTASKRESTPLALLRVSMQGRVPHLVPLKYERMAASPFGYFRGAVPVMAHDLGLAVHTGLIVQLCGDAHVRNFGAYSALDGRLVFDINDFDETIRGPFEWDVKRMATSVVLAAREAGMKERAAKDAVLVFLRRYRKTIHLLATLPVLAMARFEVHRDLELDPLAEVLNKAERSTPLHNLESLTEEVPESSGAATTNHKGAERDPTNSSASDDDTDSGTTAGGRQRRFRSEPPVLQPLKAAEAEPVLAALPAYARTLQPERRHFLAQYQPIDAAFKVVGTGSVGLRDYCIYMQGNGVDDPLFLQIKEEVPSGWAKYLRAPKARVHHGKRVVDGQRAMQLQSDPFLGYTTIEGRDYLVRQLNDHKASVDPDTFDATGLEHYADMCGELLARGHARSAEPALLSGYIGKGIRFSEAVLAFAVAYADQTERDWQQLVRSRRPHSSPGKSSPGKKKTTKDMSGAAIQATQIEPPTASATAPKDQGESY